MVGLHSAPQPNNRGCLVPAWLRSRGEFVLLEVTSISRCAVLKPCNAVSVFFARLNSSGDIPVNCSSIVPADFVPGSAVLSP
jgi:hypothetical protein